MRKQGLRIFSTVLTVMMAAFGASAQVMAPIEPGAEAPASLDRTVVPAGEVSEVLLSVARFGRYSIIATSTTGVALQLVDRMKGPRHIDGIAGESDGRLDHFLDRGQYKIIIYGHEKADGEALLQVRGFSELNAGPAPQLIDLRQIEATLEDFEQRSYWLNLDRHGWVYLEAAGRNLKDLRLWRDGNWLVDSSPEIEVVDPVEGQSLRICRIKAQLEKGLYLLSAYGGEALPWASETSEHPFYLRSGLTRLATAGRQRFEVSAFGLDRYLVPSKANLYRIELEQARPAQLMVTEFSESEPFPEWGRSERITKDSKLPIAEISNSSDDSGWDEVVVRSEAGRPYILQHFERRDRYSFLGSGEHWISTVHTGSAEDSVDATAFLAQWTNGHKLKPEPVEDQTIILASTTGWGTRCNLVEDLSVFLDVQTTGVYIVESGGIDARFRIEPFFVFRPDDYKAPSFEGSGSRWDLDRGYYVLTVKPVQKGILEMALRPESLIVDMLDLIGQSSVSGNLAKRSSVRFESVFLDSSHTYTLFLNQQPEVKAGLVLRKLPINIEEALPLTISPGQHVEVPIRLGEKCRITVRAENGSLLTTSIDGGPPAEIQEDVSGSRKLVVRNDGEFTIACSVVATPIRLLSESALPAVPQATLDGLPVLPEIAKKQTRYFDLGRSQSSTMLIKAGEDGLYRLESTGLLATSGNLRSRTITSLAASSVGGSGRNFFLGQYLLSGDYQLTVKTQGASAGHLGVTLETADAIDGGQLRAGLPARIALKAGESVFYDFDIEDEGQYHLRSMALGRIVRCRLEDDDGWPIVAPNGPADIKLDLKKGRYRLVVLPEPVSGRRLTMLEQIREGERYEGHGPHTLPLDQRVTHLWREPDEDEPRLPDSWLFEISSGTEVDINLGSEMQAQLFLGEFDREVEVVSFDEKFSGQLEAGQYRLDLSCMRNNNYFEYFVEVSPKALLPGMSRVVTAPARMLVSVPPASTIEITSFGDEDVRARLVDEQGRLIVEGDDRPGDWNVHLPFNVDGGIYMLEVEPVGSETASTTMTMELRQEQRFRSFSLPLDEVVNPGGHVIVMPIDDLTGDIFLVSARADEAIGLRIERQTDLGSWQTLATRVGRQCVIEVPVMMGVSHRLRLWSVDRRDEPIRLMAIAVNPQEFSEAQLASVVRLTRVPDFEPRVALAKIKTAGAGLLRLSGGPSTVLWSSGSEALEEHSGSLLPMTGPRATIAVHGRDRVAIKADRIRLNGNEVLQLSLTKDQSIRVDLERRGRGPVLVFASSMVSQPGVSVPEKYDPRSPMASTAITEGQTVAISLAPVKPIAELWLASEATSADVRVWVHSFDAPARHKLVGGMMTDAIAPHQAVAISLPAGEKWLYLNLTPKMVAVLVNRGDVESLSFGGDQSRVELMAGSGDELLLFNVDENDGRFGVEVFSGMIDTLRVDRDRAFKHYFVRSGNVRINVDPLPGSESPEMILHIVGASGEPTWLSDEGLSSRGCNLEVTTRGQLEIFHEKGLVMAWFGPRENGEEALWTERQAVPGIKAELPSRMMLSGSEQRFLISSEQPGVLRIANGSPLLLRFEQGESKSVSVGLEGSLRHLLVGAGEIELAVRGLSGEQLSGWLELSLTGIINIGEGLSDEIVLGPGQAQAFRFIVEEAGSIGIGLRADPDTVVCTLLDDHGTVLGRGVVQMHDLEAGTYVLIAKAEADSEMMRVRAAVVGLEKKGTGPPPEIIRTYVEELQQGGAQ